MSKLKNRKYVALLGIVLLVVGIIGLFVFGRVDKYKGRINVVNVSSSSKILSSVGNATGLDSKGTDEVSYTVTYTLDEVEGVDRRNVEIKATLSNEDSKYARFKEVKGDNITSTLDQDSKEIVINISDVELGVEKSIDLPILINNAPNGTKIKPTIEIKEATGSYTRISTQEVNVVTNSIQGLVLDENNKPVPNLELSLSTRLEEVKRTYTDEEGKFVFSDLDNTTYNIAVEEELYELTNKVEFNSQDTNELTLKVNSVEPYSIETHKYIEKLDLIVNGKEEHYTYKDAEKVIQTVKNAKTISGEIEYKIVVTNTGKKQGKVMQVEDIKGEGLSFDSKKNSGWTEKDGKLIYSPIEGTTLKSKESRTIKLVLNIDNTNEIKTYINKLTAKGEIYEKVVYIIDGKKYREEEILEGDLTNRPSVDLDNFTGWYTDKNYTNKYNFKNPVTKDLILYGYTNINHCKVTFMDWGEVYEEQQIVCGENATKPSNPKHTGYDFVKWIKPNNDEFDFNTPVEDDVVVNSKYDLITYTINYNYNGGSLAEGVTNPSTYTIETPDFEINNPSKKGYNFIGWTESDGDTPETHVVVRTGTTGNKTYIANYQIIEYPITYNLDGGNLAEGKTNRNKYTVEDEFTLNNPSKKGYDFIGWEGTDLDEATTEVTVEKGSTGARAYTAKYRVKTYTITYDGLTDSEKEALNNPITYTVETETITLVNPSNRKDSYNELSEIFTGWTGSNGNDASTGVTIPKGSTGNKEYTANWVNADDNVYPITYNLKNGKLEEGKSNPDSYTKSTETFTLNNPSKKGYNFIGWSGTDLTGNTNTTVTITKGSRGARSFEANYTAKEYTITYNLDGGSLEEGVTNPSTYTIESDDITLNNPSKIGYTFIGWEGTDVDTPSTTVTIPTGSTGNREYTAKYTKNKYTITYDLDGGSLEEGKTNPTEYTITSDDIVLNNPSKKGYEFVGWTGTDLEEVTIEVTIPTGSIGNRSYKATYRAIEYTITYDLDGGALEEGVTNPTTYTVETETFTLNNPTKADSKFNGWTGTGLSSANTAVTIPKGSTGNRSYTANWGPNVFLIKFINEGNLYATKTVNGGQTVANAGTPSSSNSHNVFKYWSKDKETEYDFSTPVNSDFNLYSVYEEVEVPTITHTPTEWTNQNVTVTVTSSHDDYTYMYKIGDGDYTSYSAPFEVEENTTIYAYSKKGSSSSEEGTHEITNIDKIKPRVNNISASGVSTTAFTINVAAVDDESGIASITVYKDDELVGEYLYDDEDTSEKIKSIELSNLTENTTYKIKAVAKDKAGNISDEVEKEFETNEPIVARIIGEDNTLWDSSQYINFSSLQAAIEYGDCVSNQCTIQMVTGTTESNSILAGQDITLDLNGQIVRGANSNYTLDNNGLLTIIDNSEDNVGILYNSEGTAILNSTDDSILTIGVNDPEYNVSVEQPRIIGNSYGINKAAGTLNFYDGYIEGVSAINGTVNDTPYLYNARVSSISNSESLIKQKAVLSKVADAEARIGSVYYTKLSDAIDKSKSGTLDVTSTDTTFANSLTTYGSYGFESRNGVIVPDESNINDSKSVITIDLTDAEEDQTIIINYEKFYKSIDNSGSIQIVDKLNFPENVNYSYSPYNNNQSKYSFTLPKGKIYYAVLSGNIQINDLSAGVQVMQDVTTKENYEIVNNALTYGFDYDEDTKTLRSNNNFISGSVAYSYLEVDLTNKTGKYEIEVSATADMWTGRYDYGIITVSETKRFEYQTYNLSYNEEMAYLTTSGGTSSSVYNSSDAPRIKMGQYLYNRIVDAGKKYYVQFYYFKNSSEMSKETYQSYGCNDEFIINSIGVYSKGETQNVELSPVTPGNYGFTGNSSITSSSSLPSGETAHSYIPIDMTGITEPKMARVTGYTNPDCDFYIGTTTSTDLPSLTDMELHVNSNWNTNFSYSETYDRIPLYFNLVPGKMNYLHLINKSSNTATINGIDIVDGTAVNLSTDLETSGSIGMTHYYEYYNYYDQILNANQTADSYVKLDFTDKDVDQIVSFTIRGYTSSSDAKYVYLSDTPSNVTYEYLKNHIEDSLYFVDQNYSYCTPNGTISYNNEYSVLLPKGRVYYMHFASHTTNSNVETLGVSRLYYKDAGDINYYSGKNPTVNGETEPITVETDFLNNDGTKDKNFRYIGSNPKNYIKFNNELWRIIGVFETEDEDGNKKDRIKITKASPLSGSYSYDSSLNTNNNGGPGINEWTQADAMKLLNPGYDDEDVGGSLYYNSKSGKCYNSSNNVSTDCDFTSTGLKASAKEFIDEVKWNTGSLNTSTFTVKELYEIERGTATGKDGITRANNPSLDESDRTTSWVGKVGFIYPSDFVYSLDAWTDEVNEVSYTREQCLEDFVSGCMGNKSWMWLDSGSYPLHTMTPSNQYPYYIVYADPGKPSATATVAPFNINPVVYLSTKTKITSGTGTSSNPYKIELGESKNTDPDYGLVEKNTGYDKFAKDDTDDQNYRYFGEDPNNYIEFNDETWRIIGIFKVEDKNGNEDYRLKIIRKDSIGRYSWDTSKPNSNYGYGINEWSQADLMKTLNSGYDNNTSSLFSYDSSARSYNYVRDDLVDNSLFWNRTSGYCHVGNNNTYQECDFSSSGLTDEAKNYIDKVKWNLGAIPYADYSSITPIDIYTYERGNKTGKTDIDLSSGFPADDVKRNTSWYGKVAIPHVTDYIMASGNGLGTTRDACMNGSGYGDCSYNNNWMNDNTYSLTLNPLYGSNSSTSNALGYMNSYFSTVLATGPVSSTAAIKPTVYLSTKTVISGGTGKSSDPYTISLGETDNELTNYGLGQDGSATPEASGSHEVIPYETNDYLRVKKMDTYGYTYDEETGKFISDNYSIPSVASSTIKLDLTNEDHAVKVEIKQNFTDYYKTFVIINESPDPIYYKYMSNYTSDYLNMNLTSTSYTIYLNQGKVYYVHLGYVHYQDDSYYGNVHMVDLKVDGGIFNKNTTTKTYDYQRNEDIDTIQILKNISADYTIEIEKNRSVILDLNGYTINSLKSGAMVKNQGELEIIDTKVNPDGTTSGKLTSSNGTVISNEKDANLKLTSGNIDTTYDGVDNVGTMIMSEGFNISTTQTAINNVDGIINDLAGTITQSSTGVASRKNLSVNGENSGTVQSITGPLEIHATSVGVDGICNISNTRIIDARTGIKCYDKLTTNNVNIENATYYGVDATLIDNMKNTVISGATAIYAGANDGETTFENVTTDSDVTLDLKSGSYTFTDESGIKFTGGFVIERNASLTIDLKENEITRSPSGSYVNPKNFENNFGNLYIKSLADTDNNIESSYGSLKVENTTLNNVYSYSSKVDFTNIDCNKLQTVFFEGYDATEHIVADITGGTIKKYINGGEYKANQRNYSNDGIVNIDGTIIGTEGSSETSISNIGTLNIKDSTVYGYAYSRNWSELTADNTIFNILVIDSYNGYYKQNSWSSSYTEDFGYRSTSTLNNSSVNQLTIGHTGSSRDSNGLESQDNNTYLNNTNVSNKVTIYPNGALYAYSGEISNVTNTGDLILGKNDDTMTKSSPIVNELTNYLYLYFYDGTIKSTDSDVIKGVGNIVDVAPNYFLKKDTEDNLYVMYLSDGDYVAQIGDQKFTTIQSAIDSIENAEENVEINIIKDHISAESITNDKNVTINLNGHEIVVYSEKYITNNGTMVINGDENSYLRRQGNDSTTDAVFSTLKDTTDTITNNGTLTLNNVGAVGFSARNNRTMNINGEKSIVKVLLNASGTMTIGDVKSSMLTNFGTVSIQDIDVEYIYNNKKLTINNNHGSKTRYSSYNAATSEEAYNNNIYGGKYKTIIQTDSPNIKDQNRRCQTVRIGSDDKEVTVEDYVSIVQGNVIMNNTQVNNESQSSYSVKTTKCENNKIENSSIYNNSKSGTADAVNTEWGLEINNSTVKCIYPTYGSSATCSATHSHKFTSNGSTLIGYDGVFTTSGGSVTLTDTTINANNNAVTAYDSIKMNSGNITSSDKGLWSDSSIEVVNGTIKTTGKAIDISSRYSDLYVGTDKNFSVLGNPTIESTNSSGVDFDGESLYVANGSIKSKSTTLDLYSTYESGTYYSVKLYVGTVAVDGVYGNPTIESTNGSAIFMLSSNFSQINNKLYIARGTVKGYSSGIYTSTSSSNHAITIGDHNDSDMHQTNPHIEGGAYGIFTKTTSSANQKVDFYDGEVIGETGNSLVGAVVNIEDGFIMMTDSEGSIDRTYLDAPKMAAIGDVEYDTINDAVTAAESGDVIKILNNFSYVDSMGKVEVPSGKNIIIDFNGKTITNKSNQTFLENNGILELKNVSTTGNNAPIVNNEGAALTYTSGTLVSDITNSGTATIKDGTIKGLNNSGIATIETGTITDVNNSGTLTVESGTISTLASSGDTTIESGNISTITENSGTITYIDGTTSSITISDGEFYLLGGTISNNSSAITIASGTLNIGEKGGEPSITTPSVSGTYAITYTGDGVVNFYDGILKGSTTVFNSTVNRKYINDIETNYQLYDKKENNEDTLILKQTNIIKNTTTGVEYNNVQSAINEAGNGETLQLMNSIVPLVGDSAFDVPIDKDIIFDFNGYNIYSRETTFDNKGKLELTSSREYNNAQDKYSQMYFLSINNSGTLTSDGITGTINELVVNNSGTTTLDGLTVNKGTITNNQNSTFTGSNISFTSSTINNFGTLNFDQVNSTTGTQTNSGNMKIENSTSFELNITNRGVLDLKGNTISTTANLTNSGTVNYETSTMTFKTIDNLSDGTINLNSGTATFSTTITDFSNKGIVNVNNIDTNALRITNSNTVNITGGTHKKSYNNSQIKGGTVNMSGGTFGIIDRATTATITGGEISEIINGTTTSIKNAEVGTFTGVATVEDSTIGTYNSEGNSTISGTSISKIYGTGELTLTNCEVGNIYERKVIINSNNTNFNGNLQPFSLHATGGTVTGDVGSVTAGTYSKPAVYTEEIYLTDVNLTGNISCIEAKITNSTVTGNIEASNAFISYDYEHLRQVELVDSTIVGNVSGPKVTVDNTNITGKIYNTSVAEIKSGSVKTEDDIAVEANTIIVGENDDEVHDSNPEIEGAVSGVKTQDLSYYDGTITGGEKAIDGKLSNLVPGYKINMLTVDNKSKATLTVLGEDEIVADTNNKFFADLQAAVNDCVDGGTVKLHRDVELTEDVIISSDKSIIIDLNNHQIVNEEHLIGNYTTTDSTNPGTGGAIYRFLASLTGQEINPKDIIIYQMDDDSELLSEKTYKLYKLMDNQYKLVKVTENRIGDYDLGNDSADIRTTNGQVKINGIGEGDYKLVGSDSKELAFSITEDGISSNIRENLFASRNKVISTSIATLILQLQTGVLRSPYLLIILVLLLLIVVSYLFIQNKKKSYE